MQHFDFPPGATSGKFVLSDSAKCRRINFSFESGFADSHTTEHLMLLHVADPTDPDVPRRPRGRADGSTRRALSCLWHKSIQSSKLDSALCKSSSGGYAGLMQRMNKARSGGGGAAQPQRMAPAHRARSALFLFPVRGHFLFLFTVRGQR